MNKIDGLATRMVNLTNAVYDATGKQMWNTFRTNDNLLRTVHLPKVESLFDLMFFWDENNPPSQYLLERYVSDVAEAVIAVNTFVTGSQGTLTQLLDSLEYAAEANDLEAYWAFVDEYRTEWRAVMAQALVALEYVNQFDPSGYT